MFEKIVFEKGNSDWIDELGTITKKYNYTVRFPLKLTPIERLFKKKRKFVQKNVYLKMEERDHGWSLVNLLRLQRKSLLFQIWYKEL